MAEKKQTTSTPSESKETSTKSAVPTVTITVPKTDADLVCALATFFNNEENAPSYKDDYAGALKALARIADNDAKEAAPVEWKQIKINFGVR